MPDLRRAQAADLDDASALCLRSKAHWGYDAAFMAACRDELTLREKDLSEDAVWLACVRERMAGVLHFIAEDDVGIIDKLFVEPDFIGQGVGRTLLDKAAAVAKAKNLRALEAVADPFAAGFYEQAGFAAFGTTPSGSIPGRTLTTYRKAL
ncbi:MAG: GNAT family N-acetyltransferase [Erythrobacter sp.]